MSEKSFFDEVELRVAAGKGGAGASHFRREKYVPFGGPDGGNGGNGGSIVIESDSSLRTLINFKHKRDWKAENGVAGSKQNSEGRRGKDEILKVPSGTEVHTIDEEGNKELLADLVEHGQKVTVAKGGRGGKGNSFFKSATNRAPTKSQPGEAGEERKVFLSLKMIADIGLIGLPNAGKSTLLSVLTAAKPKIGNYPFTTLHPHLGICSLGPKSDIVLADIPGLIEGAHEGKGLGTQFLKHIERTRALAHLIDCSSLFSEDPAAEILQSCETIEGELKSFSEELASKPSLLVLSKIDALPPEFDLASIQTKLDRPTVAISSAANLGLDELKSEFEKLMRQL